VSRSGLTFPAQEECVKKRHDQNNDDCGGAPIAITTIASSPANAQWRHHRRKFPVGPVVGGLAAGALIGAAVAGAPRRLL
jgi:hypothetical protein